MLCWAPAPSWQETWEIPAKKRGESREQGQAVTCLRGQGLLGAERVPADGLHLHRWSDAVPSGQGRFWAGCGERNAEGTRVGASREPGAWLRERPAQFLFASNSKTVHASS